MAILKGIEPKDILYKYTAQRRDMMYNYATGQYDIERVRTEYMIVELETRRARTNGASIQAIWLKNLLESLKIKIITYGVHNPYWVAVGVNHRAVIKEVYESLEVSPVAHERYKKIIRNDSFVSALDTEEKKADQVIERFPFYLSLVPLEEGPAEEVLDDTDWVEQPNTREFTIMLPEEIQGQTRRRWG